MKWIVERWASQVDIEELREREITLPDFIERCEVKKEDWGTPRSHDIKIEIQIPLEGKK